MKYVNPGILEIFDNFENSDRLHQVEDSEISDTGFHIYNQFVIVDEYSGFTKYVDSTKECWISFNDYLSTGIGNLNIMVLDADNNTIICGHINNDGYFEVLDGAGNSKYLSKKNKVFKNNTSYNFEFHFSIEDTSRIDVWIDNKYTWSYRDPSLVKNPSEVSITGFKFSVSNHSNAFSSIIYSDQRRIGYEKIIMLKADPSDEVAIPVGTSKDFTITGTPEGDSNYEITGFGVISKTTSKDAHIDKATFALNGDSLGTADVSSTAVTNFNEIYSSVKSDNTSYVRSDIEGKTLKITVNDNRKR